MNNCWTTDGSFSTPDVATRRYRCYPPPHPSTCPSPIVLPSVGRCVYFVYIKPVLARHLSATYTTIRISASNVQPYRVKISATAASLASHHTFFLKLEFLNSLQTITTGPNPEPGKYLHTFTPYFYKRQPPKDVTVTFLILGHVNSKWC